VFKRHRRHSEAARAAVSAWGLELVCQDPDAYSDTVTAVLLPDGHDADALRALILDRYNMSLGAGLGRLAGRAFRIGHLGNLGDLELAGTLCGVEMGLAVSGVPVKREGVAAALDFLTSR
jgi:alanine-glyoxylate transaminase/serine-glyoxylate transaminase/serine-pyruvate transaminase